MSEQTHAAETLRPFRCLETDVVDIETVDVVHECHLVGEHKREHLCPCGFKWLGT